MRLYKNMWKKYCLTMTAVLAFTIGSMPVCAQDITGSSVDPVEITGESVEVTLADQPENEENKTTPAVDYNHLEDGKYQLYAEMIKMDRTSYSMSNNGINHTVGLEVKDGQYYITVQFKGLAIYNKYGYLQNLSYYDEGYTYGEYGTLHGNVLAAEVLTTQKNEDGTDVIDKYNDADHLYPELVKFRLVDKASEEFVPLQVFVPIMESIAAGNGTQDVLMKLDWTKLEKTNEDIEVEKAEKKSAAVDLTDTQTNVRLQAEEGVFPDGVQIHVSEISQGDSYENTKKALTGKADSFRLYAITFSDKEGNPVTTDAMFTISYPIEIKDGETELYRIGENQTAIRMKGQIQDEKYVVTFKGSDSVALCALTQKAASQAQQTANTTAAAGPVVTAAVTTTPKTDDTTTAGICMVFMVVSAAIVVKLASKKRQSEV